MTKAKPCPYCKTVIGRSTHVAICKLKPEAGELYDLRINQRLTLEEIAAIFTERHKRTISTYHIKVWLKLYNIPRIRTINYKARPPTAMERIADYLAFLPGRIITASMVAENCQIGTKAAAEIMQKASEVGMIKKLNRKEWLAVSLKLTPAQQLQKHAGWPTIEEWEVWQKRRGQKCKLSQWKGKERI